MGIGGVSSRINLKGSKSLEGEVYDTGIGPISETGYLDWR
jgi:hypothetical protein